MLDNSSFYISAPSLGEQERTLLVTAVKLLMQDGRRFRVMADLTANAHLLVIDEDSSKGRHILQNSNPRQVKLLFSSRPTNRKNVISLKKPVDIPTLKSLLEKLSNKFLAQLQKKQAEQEQVTAVKEDGVSNSRSMFDVLLEAREQKTVVRISSPACPDIYVDGLNQSLVSSASSQDISQIVKTSLDQLKIEALPGSGFAVHNSAMNVSTLHNILWMAGIECSFGKLLQGHDLTTPVKLKAWPNFTRYSFKPEHLKLAAAIAKQSMDLTSLSKVSGVAIEDVINFYNAAYAVDLIEVGGATNQEAPPQRKVAASHRSLLDKIADRLSIWN